MMFVSGLKVDHWLAVGREFTGKADKRDMERPCGRALKEIGEALKVGRLAGGMVARRGP